MSTESTPKKPFFDIVPHIQFRAWETFFMRAFFAWMLYSRYPQLKRLPKIGETLTFPNGIARWFDLTWALEPAAYNSLYLVMVIACIVYASGFFFALASTVLFIVFLIPCTLQNSLGSISHYYQLIVLLLLGQALASWFWTLRSKAGLRGFSLPITEMHSYVVRVTLQIIAANYVLCGITKLINSKGKWILNSQYMPLQFEKIKMQHYYNNLVEAAPTLGDKLNAFAIEHRWFSMLAYTPGLLAELGGFLLLFGRAWSFWTGITIIFMHFVIKETMNLGFQQHEMMLWIYAVNVPFWVMWTFGKLLKKKQSLKA